MQQLIAHLVGDYILQSHDMATKKTTSSFWTFYHAITYTLPFLFLTQNLIALGIICITHFFIDRFRLARYLVKFKNVLFGDVVTADKDEYNTPTGYPKETPAWLSTWLLIIADNTLHLLINFIVLFYAN